MEEELRKTGLDVLGDVPWGTHLCQFYQTREDLLDILLPYFKKGLEENEFCMWVTSEPLDEKEAKEALREVLPHCDRFLEKGQIEIIPFSEWYVKDGVFNAKRVLEGWADKLKLALSRGYDGMRLTGNTFWLDKKDWKSFVDYEKEINSLIGTRKMIAVCTYSLDKCGAFEIIDVIRNHQFALIRREGEWELVESSEREKVKDEADRSEAKYQSLVENTGQGVATIDLKGRFTYANETLCKMIGYDEEELLGKNFADFLHPDEKKKIFNLFWEGLKTLRGRKLHLGFRVIHKKGHVLHWYSSPTAFRHKGRILGFSAIISDVTDRKKAEEALKNSAREWHATFDAVGDSVFLTDLEGRILRCNKAMAKFLRKPFSKIVGQNCRELVCRFESMEKCPLRRMKKSQRRETGALTISGRYFELTVDPLFEKTGDLIGAVHIMKDVTERKKAEEALRKSESRYRSLFDNMLDGFAYCKILLDENNRPTDFVYLEINEAFERLTGLKKEDIVGKQVTEAIPGIEDAHPELFDIYGKVALTGKGTEFDIYFEPLEIWLSISVYSPRKGYFVAVFGNITERKKAEEALQKSEREYRNLAESLTTLVYRADPKTLAATYVNSAVERIYGYTAEEWLKDPRLWQTAIHSDDRERVIAEITEMQREKKSSVIEYRVTKRNGMVRWAEDHVSWEEDKQGRVVSMNGLMYDITDRKEAEKKIKTYQKRLRALASKLTLTEEREKRHLATELHDSIGQLLALCRIKLGELEKVAKSTDVRSLAEEVEKGLEEIIWHTRSLTLRLGPPVLYELGLEAALEWLVEYMEEQYGVQTKFRFDGKVDPIEEELRVFIFRAVQELMMNVARHGETDKAEALVWRENETMHITVEDRGVGFDSAILDAPSGKDSGFGIFSIRERIRYFGGELSIRSKPGKGTQITLVVPIQSTTKEEGDK